MYQPNRPSTRTSASAASSPRTNPLQTNNDRQDSLGGRRPSLDPAMSSSRNIGDSGSDLGSSSQNLDDRHAEQAREAQKLNQIIQQFFAKGALTVVSSRTNLPPAHNRYGGLRQNKWFNLLLEDSEELINRVIEWRTANIEESRPPPMLIEIYLDLDELTRSQNLVIIDDQGKRWDVADALNSPASSTLRPSSSRMGKTKQLVLERWELSLGDSLHSPAHDYADGEALPNVYKRGIPLFRSLYTAARLLPAWRYYRRVSKQPASNANNSGLKLKYRILSGNSKSTRKDTLDVPLYANQGNPMQRWLFEPLHCPAGPLKISVSYRTNCDFRVDDSESLLSSHFMGMDDRYFKPSLATAAQDSTQVPGSAPAMKKDYMEEARDHSQVYGSMSTFHQVGGITSSSPISALRALADVGSASPRTPPQKMPPNHRLAQESKSSLRTAERILGNQRRPSVSFQPFKAGSLASSPASGLHMPLSPSGSVPRPSNMNMAAVRTRSSTTTTLPQAALRTPNIANETAIASSASSSPRPAPINRYSSSFTHRRSRFSSGGASKGDDDNNSSGKASASSSAQPGSDVLNDTHPGSSGSMPHGGDDDNLKDFIRLLERKRDLDSFEREDSTARDTSVRRTTIALSRYQRMRDSSAVLTDSLSSSLLLHRSSSSSSRQLSNVPPMITGTSMSTASSPGKPISPHTPHTPAIPSRLSANSTIGHGDAAQPRRSRSRARLLDRDSGRELANRDEDSSDTTARVDNGTNAIDIPTSPRTWGHGRRSSSVSQRQRSLEDEPDPYGLRSASLPVEESTGLSVPELPRTEIPVQDTAPPTAIPVDTATEVEVPTYHQPHSPREDSSRRSQSSTPDTANISLRTRPSRGSVSRQRGSPSFFHSLSPCSSAQASSSSHAADRMPSAERGGLGLRHNSHSRHSTAAQDNDEDFIFMMSELGAAGSRRSLEEGRGASNSGLGPSDRRGGRSSGSGWR